MASVYDYMKSVYVELDRHEKEVKKLGEFMKAYDSFMSNYVSDYCLLSGRNARKNNGPKKVWTLTWKWPRSS